MLVLKKWNFGLGTVFSLIVVYFILLYSRDKQWALLAFLSKWYLIIIGGLIALSVGIILIVFVLSMVFFVKRKKKKQNKKEFIEAEFKVKE